MAKTRRLPKRTQEQVVEEWPYLRQSLMSEFDNCSLATKWGLEGYPYSTPAQARGIILHRYAAEVLKTLQRTGNETIPVEEALAVLYEVAAQRDVPDDEVVYVPAPERRNLRKAAINLVIYNQFTPGGIVAVEERLYAKVSYPHPETGVMVERLISGTPDALIADPPGGAVVPDWKTTQSAPAEYKGESDDTDAGLSYGGYFQQKKYSILVLANYPAVERVTLHEHYLLDGGKVRSATVTRDKLPNLMAEVTVQAELLDRALRGGSESALWQPQPGKHCSFCPRPGQCPIERETRAEGAITDSDVAKSYAAEFVVADKVRTDRRKALKAWVEQTGEVVPVRSAKGRFEMRFRANEGGGKTFGLYVPEESDRGPDDPVLDRALDARKVG